MKLYTPSRRAVLIGAGATLATPFLKSPAYAAEPLRVGIPIWVGWMPFWIIEEKGMLAKHGVDATLIQFTVQSDARQALAANSLDVCALNTADVLVIDAQAETAKVITLTNASAGADIVISRGFDNVAEMKGKTVALEIGSVSHFFLSKVLETASLTEADVNIVNMSAQDAGIAFAAGAVDVSVTWEPFASQGIAAGGTALATSLDTPDLIIDIISARNDVLATRSDEVKRLLDAWFDALAYVDSNKDEAFEIMARRSDVTVDEFTAMWAGVKMYNRAENTELMGSANAPGSYEGAVTDLGAFLLRQDLVPTAVSATSIIDSSLLG